MSASVYTVRFCKSAASPERYGTPCDLCNYPIEHGLCIGAGGAVRWTALPAHFPEARVIAAFDDGFVILLKFGAVLYISSIQILYQFGYAVECSAEVFATVYITAQPCFFQC